MNRAITSLIVGVAPVLLAACMASSLFELIGQQMTAQPLMRRDEQIVKGVGIVLLTPQLTRLGPHPIVVTLAVGSRKEMANVSAVWLSYQLPRTGTRHIIRMRPVIDHLDGFGATVSFTEAGLWHLDIQVFRMGGIPATATFTVACCQETMSRRRNRSELRTLPTGNHPPMTTS